MALGHPRITFSSVKSMSISLNPSPHLLPCTVSVGGNSGAAQPGCSSLGTPTMLCSGFRLRLLLSEDLDRPGGSTSKVPLLHSYQVSADHSQEALVHQYIAVSMGCLNVFTALELAFSSSFSRSTRGKSQCL